MKLSYKLNDFYDTTPAEKRSGYLAISATSEDGRSIDIVTNCAGEGLFYWNHTHLCYSQELGTMQFRLPKTKRQARALLRRNWERRYA